MYRRIASHESPTAVASPANGPDEPLEGEIRPAVRQIRRLQGADERDLKQDVQNDAAPMTAIGMSASTSANTAPRPHNTSAAGPAVCAADNAPKSQPEPMIDPSDAKSRPVRPTSRRGRPPSPRRSARVFTATAT